MAGNKYTDSILKEYDSQSSLYESFSKSIEIILKTLLKDHGFFFQATSHDLKSKTSLAKKVDVGHYKNLSEIQDVARCRIIFYLESDINKFAQHIFEEFGRENIIKFDLKYSEDSYNASHIVVKLDKKRLGLSEYSKFKNLICEIQLTTVLFHAWSEMAHNTIYKPSKELEQFDEAYLKSIKDEFGAVMKNHIKEASYSFEFIYKKMEELKRGKNVFSLEFFKSVASLTSNNEIYERMKLLADYVGKFGDKAPKELGIIDLIEAVLEKSAKLKTEPVKSVIGTLRGMEYSDVAIQCIEILEDLRYFHTEKVFHLLVKLSTSKNKSIVARALKGLETQSKYTLQVLRNVGYYPQEFLLKEINNWDDKRLKQNLDVLKVCLGEILNSSFEGSEWTDYRTLSWQSGSLKASEKLEELRNTALKILKKVYALSDSMSERKKVIDTMEEATHTPQQGNYSQEITDLVIKSTNEVIDFYISIIKNAENRIIKEVDEQAQWFKERFKIESLPNLPTLEKLLEENESYQTYRVLVGHEYRYKNIDNWQEAERVRTEKLNVFIKDFAEKTYNKWEKVILAIAKDNEQSSDVGEFQNFFKFLNEIGRNYPDLAFKLIKRYEKELSSVILHLFSGLWESEKRTKFKKMVLEWVEKGQYLILFSAMQIHSKPFDVSLLQQLYKKANSKKDIRTLCNVIQAVIYNYNNSTIMKKLFIDSIETLTKEKNSDWVFPSWFKFEPILKDLDKNEVELVLDNLIYSNTVDYHVEEALKILSSKYPESVINFFYKRIKYKLDIKPDVRYDAVPYKFYELDKSLVPVGKQILPLIFNWFKEKDWLFKWEASRIINNIYPNFSPELETMLLDAIKTGGNENGQLVLNVLDNYNGEIFTHNVCKEFVKKYEDKDFRNSLDIALSKTGVVSGEYGLMQAFEKKVDEIQPWKKDENKEVRNFAKKYEQGLKRQIVWEKKGADDMIHMMKKTYGG